MNEQLTVEDTERVADCLYTARQMEGIERHAKRLGLTTKDFFIYITVKYLDDNATL